MTILPGADSELPQPGFETGKEIWGVYIAGDIAHVWSHAEVASLGLAKVRAVLPIVIPTPPSPGVPWWFAADEGAVALVRLIADARAWGLPGGSPLVLDIEQGTAEAMIAHDATLPAKVEARFAAAATAYGYHPWTYGGATWHDAVGPGHVAKRWLAAWPATPPTSLELPAGYDGWQYEGNAKGGRIDLDIFAGGLEYLGCDGIPAIFGSSAPSTAPPTKEIPPVSTTTTTAAEILASPQLASVNDAIGAQIATIRTAIAEGNLAAAQATAALLTTHVAELTTLLSGAAVAAPPVAPVGGTVAPVAIPPELAAVESAIDAQVASIKSDVAAGNYTAANATAALLATHVAELTTLLAAL